MKAILAFPLVSAALVGAVHGQSPNPRVDAIFAPYDKPDSPGCAVSVLDGDKMVFAKGYGMASLEHSVPITPATAFYAASVSKQFTAFAVTMLAKQGKLSLDDDIRKWIPEVPNFGKTITVRHLIHHTSGLRDYFGLLGMTGWESDGPITEAQFLDLVSRQKSLNFDPGARHLYSNTGYVLLSILVKRVSGQSLREFADASMFGPLGMTNSHFRDDHTMLVKNRALAYSPARGGWRLNMPGFDVVGDGGLFTTVEDLAKWARNFDDRAVSGDVVTQVLTRGRLNSGDSIAYAYGLQYGTYRGLPTVEHGGAYGGYRTNLLRFPAQRVAVAMLCNTSAANTASLSQQVAALYLGDRLPAADAGNGRETTTSAPAFPLTREQLSRYVGAYWNSAIENLARIELRDTTLALVGTPVRLIPVADGRFRASNGPGTFVFDGAARLEITTPIGEKTVYQRMPPADGSPAKLASYVADYYSDELDTIWRIDVKNGALVVRRRAQPDETLQPVYADAFQSPAGVLRFTRDADGRVTGFVVGAGRVTGFRFTMRRSR